VQQHLGEDSKGTIAMDANRRIGERTAVTDTEGYTTRPGEGWKVGFNVTAMLLMVSATR
jgi:hypothetical protein